MFSPLFLPPPPLSPLAFALNVSSTYVQRTIVCGLLLITEDDSIQ